MLDRRRTPGLRPAPRKRDQKHTKKSVTISTDNRVAWLTESSSDRLPERPRVRNDCVNGPRPCPWAGCRHHLYLDVSKVGGLILNFPDQPLEACGMSCALDIAERGGQTLEEVGQAMNLTRERVRQIERTALDKLGRRVDEP